MFLIRILIVDDEVIFRNYLKGLLDWASFGYTICGEAENGIHAKHLLEETRPHIVITDICMSEVDGLSLIAFIQENYSEIQIIVLSGYEKYEYVRTSMRNGVLDYLLKHKITKKSLLIALRSAVEKIARQDREQMESIRITEQREQGQLVLKQKFLRSFLFGDIDEQTVIEQNISKFSLPFVNHNILIVVAAIDGISQHKQVYSEKQWQALFDRVIEIVNAVVTEMVCGIVLPLSDSQFTILFCIKGRSSLLLMYNQVESCIRQIRRALKMHCNITACYSIGTVQSNVFRLPAVFQKTYAMLGNKIYHNYDMIIREDAIPSSQNEPFSISIQDEQNILNMLSSSDKDKLLSFIKMIFEDCRRHHLDEARLRIIMAELLNPLGRELKKYKLDIMDVHPSYHKIFENIQHMTLNEMRDCVLYCYQRVLDAKEKLMYSDDSHSITQKACAYMSKHFAENISSSGVAEMIGVTPSYLSRVFRKDMNQTVVEYLNQIRIEQAKKMIADGGIQLGTLAKQTGFNSNTYFFTVFKRLTGKTPQEYKKMLEKEV